MVHGANVDEEPSTLAVIREDSLSDVYDDDDKWRQPWSEEELEHLAITMEDFEVSFLEHSLGVITGFAL